MPNPYKLPSINVYVPSLVGYAYIPIDNPSCTGIIAGKDWDDTIQKLRDLMFPPLQSSFTIDQRKFHYQDVMAKPPKIIEQYVEDIISQIKTPRFSIASLRTFDERTSNKLSEAIGHIIKRSKDNRMGSLTGLEESHALVWRVYQANLDELPKPTDLVFLDCFGTNPVLHNMPDDVVRNRVNQYVQYGELQ